MNARRQLSGFRYDEKEILVSERKGELIEIPCQKGTVMFECEIQQPKSMKGRTVYVYFQDEDLTDALKVLRDAAIYARSQPMDPH